jgi:molybdopterin molybdotransferase
VISYAEAFRILKTSGRALPHRVVPLSEAAGAVTAGVLAARLAVPGFANAAMDGFALHAAATRAASADSPVRMAIAGVIAAGEPAPPHQGGMAWEILTGAPVSPGFDAVVPLEQVTRVDDPNGGQAAVLITAPVEPGQNIRQRGQDFLPGQSIVDAGTRLAPHHLMALAAGGVDEVPVVTAPRIAVLTTGNELATHGAELAPARIRDANGPYLRALLPLLGAELTAMATARDRADDLDTQLGAFAGTVDIVLTTGGVSAGRHDLVPSVVRELGGQILFHKVAIRPGKPIFHARLPDGTLVFGLPGNPLAVAVGMRFFVIPALRALQGMPPERECPALTIAPVRGRDRLCFFAKAYAETDATGCRRVQILPGQESFRIAPLLRANCWAIVPAGAGEIPAGGTLATLPLYPDDCLGAPFP